MALAIDLTRFRRYVTTRVSELEPAAAGRLVAAPWQHYAEVAARELGAYLTATDRPVYSAIAIRWNTDSNVQVDTDDHQPAFVDGPRDPRAVLDGAAFARDALGIELDELDEASDVRECLAFLCAELVVHNSAVLASRAAAAWAVAVQPGHDETPRIVYRSKQPSPSVFTEAGAFVAKSVDEEIDEVGDDGLAIAELFGRCTAAGDTMNLLARAQAVFMRVAKGDRDAGRDEVMAVLRGMAANARRLSFGAWGETFERVLITALAATGGHRPGLELVAGKLLPKLTMSTLPFNLGCCYALAGDRDQALRWTKRALEMGHDAAKLSDSDFDSLREDAEFRKIASATELSPAALTQKLGDAVGKLDVAEVKALIARGADVNGKCGYEHILVAAAHTRAWEDEDKAHRMLIVTLLLDAGAKIQDDDWPWYSIAGDTKLLTMLLDRGVGVTEGLVTNTVEKEQIALLELLVARGVDLNAYRDELRSACRHHKSTATLQYLIDRGFDVTAFDDEPFALGFASSGNLTMLDFLVGKGIDVQRRSKHGASLISEALFNDKSDIVTWAIKHGAALDVQSSAGTSLIHEAVSSGAKKSFPILLDAGAPVSLRDHQGRTALHVAAEGNYLSIAKLLLECGADPNAKDSEGNTPATLAEGPALKELLANPTGAVAKKPAAKKAKAQANKKANPGKKRPVAAKRTNAAANQTAKSGKRRPAAKKTNAANKTAKANKKAKPVKNKKKSTGKKRRR